MPFDRTKIRYVYSGSGSSSAPELSLGGAPSLNYVTGNKLFSNVTATQAGSGKTDYRCVYLVNENPADSLYNTTVVMAYDYPNTVSIDFGFVFQNERQTITINTYTVGTTTGKFVLKYTDAQGDYSFDVDADTIPNMSDQITTELESVVGSGNVTVTGTQIGSLKFQIDFVNDAGSRYHDILEVTSNTLNPATTVTVAKTVSGAPINSQADSIDVDTTPPVNVSFGTAATVLGEFKGLDVLPVWIRRTIDPDTSFVENDSFILRIKGTIFPDN